MTAPDPTDLFREILAAATVRTGDELLTIRDGCPVIRYGCEADVREGIARWATALGWNVQQEVVIPGWGRIDVVLHDHSGTAYLLEVKVDLSQPAAVRKAFQQADGYGRWWAGNRGEPASVRLLACKSRADVIAPVAAAYPEVEFLTVTDAMACMVTAWGAPKGRIHRARARVEQVELLLDLHRFAIGELARLVES